MKGPTPSTPDGGTALTSATTKRFFARAFCSVEMTRTPAVAVELSVNGSLPGRCSLPALSPMPSNFWSLGTALAMSMTKCLIYMVPRAGLIDLSTIKHLPKSGEVQRSKVFCCFFLSFRNDGRPRVIVANHGSRDIGALKTEALQVLALTYRKRWPLNWH